MKLLRVADVRDCIDPYDREEISYTKMVELLNEAANRNFQTRICEHPYYSVMDTGMNQMKCLVCGKILTE